MTSRQRKQPVPLELMRRRRLERQHPPVTRERSPERPAYSPPRLPPPTLDPVLLAQLRIAVERQKRINRLREIEEEIAQEKREKTQNLLAHLLTLQSTGRRLVDC